MLTCKWCGWTCLRWKRQKNGKLRDGWDTLWDHIDFEHHAEALKIERLTLEAEQRDEGVENG